MKNIRPRTLVLYTALAVGLITLLLTWASGHWLTGFGQAVLVATAVAVVSFGLFYYFLDHFIYRKIKLIYKLIHSVKVGRFQTERVLNPLTDEDPLNEVQQEVREWIEKNQREIESIRLAEQYRREFLSNLSHEFKTPLFSIQGYVHTLLEGAMNDGDVRQHFLERTAAGIDRLANLIADLEQISQLEGGQVQLDMETFDIYSLTRDVFEEMEFKANTRGIRFSIKKGCERPFYVVGDKERIRQVLVNLFDNSIKYGKEDGSTVVSFYDMGEHILIEVTDNGVGIAAEHIPRVFERFFRVDKSRSREQGGTGLGLAIVKHIVEAHGQTINVRSTLGVGSTFGFTLQKSMEG